MVMLCLLPTSLFHVRHRARNHGAKCPSRKPHCSNHTARTLQNAALKTRQPHFASPYPAEGDRTTHVLHEVALRLLVQAQQPHDAAPEGADGKLERGDGEGVGEGLEHLLVVAASEGGRGGGGKEGQKGRLMGRAMAGQVYKAAGHQCQHEHGAWAGESAPPLSGIARACKGN